MAERLKAPVLKTGKGATLSWVRIPVLPPKSINTLLLNILINLIELEKFVNLSDEDLIKLNRNFSDVKIKYSSKIYKEFYNFKPY